MFWLKNEAFSFFSACVGQYFANCCQEFGLPPLILLLLRNQLNQLSDYFWVEDLDFYRLRHRDKLTTVRLDWLGRSYLLPVARTYVYLLFNCYIACAATGTCIHIAEQHGLVYKFVQSSTMQKE